MPLTTNAGMFLFLPLALFHVPSQELEPTLSVVTAANVDFEDEVNTLAMALYFEGNINEPLEGLQAIASVIINRKQSPYFPDTIRKVVSHGARPGKTNGGCQFSFMCDKYPEDIQLLCQLRPLDLEKHWGENPCEKRWEAYLAFARGYLENGADNTNGANMYYAAWMGKPYWYKDLIKGSIVRRGSHFFGRSRHFEVKVTLQ